jgi:hypothetical protein
VVEGEGQRWKPQVVLEFEPLFVSAKKLPMKWSVKSESLHRDNTEQKKYFKRQIAEHSNSRHGH